MTDHRVHSLRLHLRSHGPPPADVEADARTFSERLLTAITDRLDARANGKLVLVRRLPIRIRARRELFADRAELERIADDVAASIRLDSTSAPAEHDDVVLFDDEVAWRASYLVEVAHGRASTAWWFATLAREPDGIAGLTTAPRAETELVLAHLARAGALPPLLARSPLDTIARLASVLELAASTNLAAGSPADVATRTRAELERSILAHALRDETGRPFAAPPVTVHEHAAPPSVVADDRTDAASTIDVHRTQYGGLVYLVRCLLELDAGEILWRACVPEAAVIASALAGIANDDTDPAPALLGGASPRDRFEASSEQREEIVGAMATSLASALPRRGLAADPEIVLHVVETTLHHRVLAAFLGDWSIFAAPATTIAETARAIDTLLELLPAARFVASPAIAELNARIETRPLDITPPPLSLRTDLSLDAALVVAVTGGCAAALVYARAGDVPLAARARIHDEGDRRIVTMAIDAIHIALRRAGLDRDPGWVAWLQRHVAIVFEE